MTLKSFLTVHKDQGLIYNKIRRKVSSINKYHNNEKEVYKQLKKYENRTTGDHIQIREHCN